MYTDQDSIKIFERQHAREHLSDLARQQHPTSGTHLFRSHARAEGRDGMLGFVASFLAVLMLVAALAFAMG